MKRGQVSHESVVIGILIFILLLTFFSRSVFRTHSELEEGIATIEALHVRNALKSVANLGPGSSYSTMVRSSIKVQDNRVIVESNQKEIIEVPAGMTLQNAEIEPGLITIANTGNTVELLNTPGIKSIIPSKQVHVGDTVYLSGDHFRNDMVLYFDNVKIQSDFIDEHTIRFTVPNKNKSSYILYIALGTGSTLVASNSVDIEIL